MSMSESILFVCPCCEAQHERGFVDGVDTFRCLRCGYIGHGFHPDREIDKACYEAHLEGNALNRAAGVSEVPLGVDRLDFAS